MALTRPLINNLNTTVEVFQDPITVLHGGATLANVDVGFIMNRANGLVSNVALYWNESSNSFVTAFTSNSGATDTNISATSYANVTTANVSLYGIRSSADTGNIAITGNLVPTANIAYDLGTTTQRFKTLFLSGNTIDLGGALITTDVTTGAVAIVPIPTTATPNPTGIVISPAGSITTITSVNGAISAANIGTAANTVTASNTSTFANANVTGNLTVGGNLTVAGTVTFTNSVVETSTELVQGVEVVAGNLVANSGTASSSTTTGALVVAGGAGISGNLNLGGNLTVGGTFSASNIFTDRGGDTLDWNTLTTMGVYLINRSSWSGTTNTPINSQYFTGQLEVVNTGNVSIAQFYRPYNSTASGDVYWTRSKHSSSAWSSWVEIINGAETMDGGSF